MNRGKGLMYSIHETDPGKWLLGHEARFGPNGVRDVAEHGVSPYAWNFCSDRAIVRILAMRRLAELTGP